MNPAAGTPPPVMNCGEREDRDIQRALYNGARYGRIQDKHMKYLEEVWRVMREEEDAARRNTDFPEQYRQLRVKYMAGEINEEEWRSLLQRKEKDANCDQARQHVREVFIHASRDLIRQILTPNTDRDAIVRSVSELIAYCNTCYATVSKRFNRKIRKIVLRCVVPEDSESDLSPPRT